MKPRWGSQSPGERRAGQPRVVGFVVEVLRRRDVDVVQRRLAPGEDAVRGLDRVGEVGRHDQG